jgi:hypothetical protein
MPFMKFICVKKEPAPKSVVVLNSQKVAPKSVVSIVELYSSKFGRHNTSNLILSSIFVIKDNFYSRHNKLFLALLFLLTAVNYH